MPASKVARLLVTLPVGAGDSVKTRGQHFAGEAVDILFEQAKNAGQHRATPSLQHPLTHFCSMKIAEVVRKNAAERGIAEEEALQNGMEEMNREFTKKSAEV